MHLNQDLIKKKLKEELKRWAIRYDGDETNSFKKFYPTLILAKKYFKNTFESISIITSHSDSLKLFVLRSRQWGRYKYRQDPNFQNQWCECDSKSTQDGWYMVFLRSFLDEEKKQIMEKLNLMDDNGLPPNFEQIPRNENFSTLFEFAC